MSDQHQKAAAPTRARLEGPSRLERVAGGPLVEVGLTAATAAAGAAVATMAATTLLPLLPILAKSLAAGRQERRIARNLAAIEQVLIQHDDKLERLSDEQYALINEIVLAAMGSTNDTKLAYLQNAVQNALALSELPPQEAVVLGRLAREPFGEAGAVHPSGIPAPDALTPPFAHGASSERIRVQTPRGKWSRRSGACRTPKTKAWGRGGGAPPRYRELRRRSHGRFRWSASKWSWS
ncbi:hypothetical protein BN948_01475 [Hydrogenophaga intermedia]|uniref:Uncharacterized protein n=1 Tax=Hydrogenophaga intermedia TaxID=65786 RepID=A0A1L1PLX8_HYDIT|nr:hypothetical protein BN948_01475 [Hydrogenophaga intermedia]